MSICNCFVEKKQIFFFMFSKICKKLSSSNISISNEEPREGFACKVSRDGFFFEETVHDVWDILEITWIAVTLTLGVFHKRLLNIFVNSFHQMASMSLPFLGMIANHILVYNLKSFWKKSMYYRRCQIKITLFIKHPPPSKPTLILLKKEQYISESIPYVNILGEVSLMFSLTPR